MDVRKRFSISFSLEKERSALQLVTIKTTCMYILIAIATLGKVSCTPLSIISLYKNSSVLMFPGSSSLYNISATWQSDIARQCRDHLGMIQRVSWQLSVALLEIMRTGNQSSQTDQPVAYKLVGVGLEKQ